MHKIKVNKQKCSLCNSTNTESKAIFNGSKYQIVTTCKNANCISNNLNKNERKN